MPKKKKSFLITEDSNAKAGRQEIPGVTASLALKYKKKARQRLTEFCQKNALVIADTIFQQHKRQLNIWTSQMVNTKILLVYTLQPKKIPYDCTVKMTNRFKGLGLIERAPEEIWMELHDTEQDSDQNHHKKKKCKKVKLLSEEALQIAEERREEKGRGRE